MVVLTNFHVVQDTTDLSVTFSDGNGYAATVLGTDPYADLAVVSVDAPAEELKPLTIVSSSGLAGRRSSYCHRKPVRFGGFAYYGCCQCAWSFGAGGFHLQLLDGKHDSN